MNEIKLFILPACPYCREALAEVDKLLTAHPQYKTIPLRIIDESADPAQAAAHDYYYVPTFYINGLKIHEGAIKPGVIENIFRQAAH